MARLYDGLLLVLAGVAAALLGATALIIPYDVTLRELGYRPPVWTIAASEYAMLYAVTLGAPWLLNRQGHITVEALTAHLPPRPRAALNRVMCLIGAVVCFVLTWYALRVMLTAEGYEIRSFEMPRWLLYATMPSCFLMLGIEFLRLAAGRCPAAEPQFEEGL